MIANDMRTTNPILPCGFATTLSIVIAGVSDLAAPSRDALRVCAERGKSATSAFPAPRAAHKWGHTIRKSHVLSERTAVCIRHTKPL